MGRHVSELTIEELAKAGAEAADAAVTDTLTAGVPVTGYLTDETGNVWLARQLPNGETERIELIEAARATKPSDLRAPRKKLAS